MFSLIDATHYIKYLDHRVQRKQLNDFFMFSVVFSSRVSGEDDTAVRNKILPVMRTTPSTAHLHSIDRLSRSCRLPVLP